jgi:hypothetical protein
MVQLRCGACYENVCSSAELLQECGIPTFLLADVEEDAEAASSFFRTLLARDSFDLLY